MQRLLVKWQATVVVANIRQIAILTMKTIGILRVALFSRSLDIHHLSQLSKTCLSLHCSSLHKTRPACSRRQYGNQCRAGGTNSVMLHTLDQRVWMLKLNSQHTGWKVHHSTDWPEVESMLCISVTRYPTTEARGGDRRRSNAPTYPGGHTHTLGFSDWGGEVMKRQRVQLPWAVNKRIMCVSVELH